MKKLLALVLFVCVAISAMLVGCGGEEEVTPVVQDPLRIDKTSIELMVGEKEIITANLKDVKWVSENDGIAVVIDGKVTAVSVGSTTITAEKGEEKVQCVVTVKEQTSALVPYPVLVFSVKAETILTGYSFDSEAYVYINNGKADGCTITYSTGNAAVATVSESGRITGVSEGVANITASAVYEGKQLSETLTITVTDVMVNVSYKNVSQGRLEMGEEEVFSVDAELSMLSLDSTGEITATPCDSSLIEWESDNETVATVSNDGVISAKNVGDCVISSKYQGETINYISLRVKIPPRTSFDFEDAGDLQYVTMSGMTNMERVANDGTFAPVHENSGNYILKGTPTDGNATFTFNFGQTLAAGTKLKFSIYVANEDNNVYGWFPIIVNGSNQGSDYAYWTSGTQWNKDSWAEGPWTLQSDASSLSICCNFAGFFSNGGNALDISKLTVYIDNIVVILPKTTFDFESTSDLQYVTMSGMTNMERVANDGTFAPVHENSGNYILKGTPTDGNATFTFNFGQTLAAGTQLHFSIYVANEDDNVYGWFPLIVNGLNQSYNFAYWTSGTQWSKDSWAEGPWTLQSDASSLSICCNFAGFSSNGGNALDISKLTVYIDNVMVV